MNKHKKASRGNTCGQVEAPCHQERKETGSHERVVLSLEHIKNRFGMSMVPDWFQQWALGTRNGDPIQPTSDVEEGNSPGAVEKDPVRRKA
jgi:hypothetical protein